MTASFLGRAFSASVSLRLGFVPRGACCASIVAQLWEPAARLGTGAVGQCRKALALLTYPMGVSSCGPEGLISNEEVVSTSASQALSLLYSDVHKRAGMDGSPVPLARIPEPMLGDGEGDTHAYTCTTREWMVTGTPRTNLGLCLACARRRQHKETILSSLAMCWRSSNNLKNSAMSGKMQSKAQGCLCFLPHALWHGQAELVLGTKHLQPLTKSGRCLPASDYLLHLGICRDAKCFPDT